MLLKKHGSIIQQLQVVVHSGYIRCRFRAFRSLILARFLAIRRTYSFYSINFAVYFQYFYQTMMGSSKFCSKTINSILQQNKTFSFNLFYVMLLILRLPIIIRMENLIQCTPSIIKASLLPLIDATKKPKLAIIVSVLFSKLLKLNIQS